MINLLITGSNGQLGSELLSLKGKFSNFNFFLTDIDDLNIVNYSEVEKYVTTNKIDVIINCAAYTNVDKAEEEPDSADEINSLAVKNIAEIVKKFQLKLIHISTDYVFDGNSSKPYSEDDETNPQSVYGATKLKGETALLEINPGNSLIIRTAWLYSSFGNNFVKTMLKLSADKQRISVVADQIGSPTYANDLANAILQIIPSIKNKDVQVYHYANKGTCSWFQFAEEIMKLSKNSCVVEPITSKMFNAKAKRPNLSLLNTEKFQKTFQIHIPDWKESLGKCLLKLKVRS
jgi:dTDP-4-dehydrorhamnose reductase